MRLVPDCSRYCRNRPDFTKSAAVWIAVIVATYASVSCLQAESPNYDAPLIFAAASLADVTEEVADSYSEYSGNDVRFTFSGSNLAAGQIVDAGAPADAVWFAGWTPISRLVDAGMVAEHEVVWVCFNKIVVVVAAGQDTETRLSSLHELVGAGSIAIPDPEAAPAGEYARAALSVDGVWDEIAGQVVPTLDARAALAAVTSGGTDFAIVYATDASTANVKVVFEPDIPNDVPPPFYYAALLSENVVAAGFLEYLSSGPAKLILDEHGFPPLGGVPEWVYFQ